MDLQYISDADGKPNAVVIPIEDWNRLTTQHQELKDLEKETDKSSTMSSFKGILSSQESENLQSFVSQSRSEWGRDF